MKMMCVQLRLCDYCLKTLEQREKCLYVDISYSFESWGICSYAFHVSDLYCPICLTIFMSSCLVNINTITLISHQEIVCNILKIYNKRLDDNQLDTLVSKQGSSNPLWLTLACEELRVFGQFEELIDKIESLPDDLIR